MNDEEEIQASLEYGTIVMVGPGDRTGIFRPSILGWKRVSSSTEVKLTELQSVPVQSWDRPSGSDDDNDQPNKADVKCGN